MLIPWASQQQGGSPAPLIPIVLSDFQNGVYEISGASKVITDLWALSGAGEVTPGIGYVVEAGTAVSSVTGSMSATSDVLSAVDLALGASGVISVEPYDTSGTPGNQVVGVVLGLDQSTAPYNAFRLGIGSDPAGTYSLENRIEAFRNNGLTDVDNAVALDPTIPNVLYKIAFTLSDGLLAVSYNGNDCVTSVPTASIDALLNFISLQNYVYHKQSKMVVRRVDFYHPITDLAVLKALST